MMYAFLSNTHETIQSNVINQIYNLVWNIIMTCSNILPIYRANTNHNKFFGLSKSHSKMIHNIIHISLKLGHFCKDYYMTNNYQIRIVWRGIIHFYNSPLCLCCMHMVSSQCHGIPPTLSKIVWEMSLIWALFQEY